LFYGFDKKNPFKKYNHERRLQLDRMQIITPYHSQHYGTLAINNSVQKKFKDEIYCNKSGCIFLDT